jgi:hypothetical protein
MADREHAVRKFTGKVQYQFAAMLQGEFSTDKDGSQVFIAILNGMFGTPPNGEAFQTEVRLSAGAQATDEAFEVRVAPALRQLGAQPKFAQSARDYVNWQMSGMMGPHWRQMTGLRMSQNTFGGASPLHEVNFEDSSDAW